MPMKACRFEVRSSTLKTKYLELSTTGSTTCRTRSPLLRSLPDAAPACYCRTLLMAYVRVSLDGQASEQASGITPSGMVWSENWCAP